MTLDQYMSARDLRDHDLALKVGVDRSYLSKIRRGLVNPTWQVICRICEATGGEVQPNDFLPTDTAA